MTDTTPEQARVYATSPHLLPDTSALIESLADQVDRLTAERDALKADEKRMDWLEASPESHGFCHIQFGDYHYYAHQQEGYPSVRETIDAAIKKEKQ